MVAFLRLGASRFQRHLIVYRLEWLLTRKKFIKAGQWGVIDERFFTEQQKSSAVSFSSLLS
jgi:hypothetical protein